MFGSTSNRPVNVLNAITGQPEVVAAARNEGPAATVGKVTNASYQTCSHL